MEAANIFIFAAMPISDYENTGNTLAKRIAVLETASYQLKVSVGENKEKKIVYIPIIPILNKYITLI